MKKILILSAMALFFSCTSNDDDEKENCDNKVWNVTQTGGNYFATYGPTAASAGTISINEATYDFYTEAGNVTDGTLCWTGTKD